jgi:hypothetical protein
MPERLRSGILAVALAAALFGGVLPAIAQDEPVRVVGTVTWISEDAVEVAGRRGIFEPGSDVRSDGRTVSKASVRPGMAAEMELDAAGRVLELRVSGVVE